MVLSRRVDVVEHQEQNKNNHARSTEFFYRIETTWDFWACSRKAGGEPAEGAPAMTNLLKILSLLALPLILTAGVIERAHAYSGGRWCAVFNVGNGVAQERCSYPTFETCLDDARVYGSSSFCRQSNYYLPYWGVGGERRPHMRAKKRHRAAH
jgi:hypothetical protein